MDFDDMLLFVRNKLEEGNAIRNNKPLQQFRSRYTHTIRVYDWCKRLLPDLECNSDVVLASAIFHDVGYVNGKMDHEKTSAKLFNEYAEGKRFDKDFIDKVTYNILNHSDKSQLKKEISPELTILLEADLLDEEGALGIAWDLMAEGKNDPSDYGDALKAVWTHSAHILFQDYMVTPLAKKYWEEKKQLVKSFINALEEDLFIGGYN